MQAIKAVLKTNISSIPYAWVEDVGGISLTVHWRQTPPEHHDRTARIVTEAVGRFPVRLVMDRERYGAMVEQPIDWCKGPGLQKLLQMINWDGVVVALGDSEADDSMFTVAHEHRGFGIRVGSRASASARGQLSEPEQVYAFLHALKVQMEERPR